MMTVSWTNSIGRDISHYNSLDYNLARQQNCWWQIKITESNSYIDPKGFGHHAGLQGKLRGAYHFARPVDINSQIAFFLGRKESIGTWERPDMLDCEFAGITGGFIREIVREYRRQSGSKKVMVYIGLHDILTTCKPETWWDPDIYMWVSRYRKIGPPQGPDSWASHLGFDHPGLSTYQWDNAQPFYSAGPVGDISYERVNVMLGDTVTFTPEQESKILEAADNINTFLVNAAWRLDALQVMSDTMRGGTTSVKGQPVEIVKAIKTINDRLVGLEESVVTIGTRIPKYKVEGSIDFVPEV